MIGLILDSQKTQAQAINLENKPTRQTHDRFAHVCIFQSSISIHYTEPPSHGRSAEEAESWNTTSLPWCAEKESMHLRIMPKSCIKKIYIFSDAGWSDTQNIVPSLVTHDSRCRCGRWTQTNCASTCISSCRSDSGICSSNRVFNLSTRKHQLLLPAVNQ